MTHGLTRAEAAARLVTYGRNELPRPRPPSAGAVLLRQFRSPLIYVLIVAGIVALALAHFADATLIAVVLVVNAIIGTAQEYRAERSAEALRSMVPDRAIAVRDGEQVEVNAEEIVPGDVVLVESGTKVPADLRLSSATGLEADESLLTGESVPVSKTGEGDAAYAGTIVVRGRGSGVVENTGARTKIGALASSLAAGDAGKPPLLQRMDRFARRIAVAVAVSVLVIGLVAVARAMPASEVFLVCVALAVSAIPEGLPVALTIALAIATRRMSKRNVIVRKLVAVEALGSCTFVASDKTGTLTVNELALARIAVPHETAWQVTSTPADPDGRIEPAADIEPALAAQLAVRMATTAALCNDGFLARRDGAWIHHGDAVDVALLAFAHGAGLVRADLDGRLPQVASIPFEAEIRFAASIRREHGRDVAHVKGAYERIVPMCGSMMTRAGDVAIEPSLIRAQALALAEEGFRVLAVAAGPIERTPGEGVGPHGLRDLVFLGLLAMIDPPRPEAKSAIAECRAAGVEVAMVTGDHPVTALAIARELGMADSAEEVVTGVDLAEAAARGDESLDALVRRGRVFARVEPQQKLDIVRSLTRLGHFVAVTGDGANDAPALRAAHVGVAMARRGTDVAREASSLIVTDDNFASIVAGIEEGRVAYANIRKVVFLLVSAGATEVALFLVAIAIGLPPPLLPAQLLWLNLVTNGIQDVALAFEPAEGGELRKPPRPPREPIFDRRMLERVGVTAGVMGLCGVYVFRSHLAAGWSLDAARNALLLLMVLFENFQVGASRSETRSMFALDPRRNPLLLFGTLAALVVHVAAMATPGIRSLLRTEMLPAAEWPRLVLLALLAPIALEVLKAARGRWPLTSSGGARGAGSARRPRDARPSRGALPAGRPDGAAPRR